MKLPLQNLRHQLFEYLPGACLVLEPLPPFRIIDVNQAYLDASSTDRSIIGKALFDVFPDNPELPDATGVHNLKNSLQQVIQTGKKHHMQVQRYDTRMPHSNEFVMRYWRPLNIPVFDDDGSLSCIIHSVEDVTDQVVLKDFMKKREENSEQQIIDAISITQETERMLISRDLHDNINQILITCRMYLDRALVDPQPLPLIQSGYELVEQAIREIKQISFDLKKNAVENNDLEMAVDQLLSQVASLGKLNTRKNFNFPVNHTMDPAFKVAAFRIIQEAVTNILKHADASSLEISCHINEDHVELVIKDDGKGCHLDVMKQGMGIRNMKARVAQLNGRFDIESAPDEGCKIIIKAPLSVNH